MIVTTSCLRSSGSAAQSSVLVYDPRFVEQGLHVEHSLLGGFQYRIQSAYDSHRENDIAVFAAHVEVAQHIVGDAPNEIGDPGELAVFHAIPSPIEVEARPFDVDGII